MGRLRTQKRIQTAIVADNYLEKKMEDYRRGQTALPMSSHRKNKNRIGLRVFVIGGETPSGAQIVIELRKSGWRVAFTNPDIKSGRHLAQATGSQHHPISPSTTESLQHSFELISDHWGCLDLVIDCMQIPDQNTIRFFKERGIPVIFANANLYGDPAHI